MAMAARIFIQIAAYRDPELVPTLRDCVAKADRPDLLTFGIAWQRDETETLAEFANDDRIRLFECDWSESRGACWARHALQQFYDGERYTLALDSHHRFVKGWDSALKRQLARLPADRPVLTAYLPAFTPGAPLPKPWMLVLAADEFSEAGILLSIPKTVERWRPYLGPVRARFFSAHFTFSAGSFLADCGHDPMLYFHGEEITLAVRAFTHGYDLFHPSRPVIYHEYTREGLPKHWNDHGRESGRPFGAGVFDHISKARARQLLGMEPATQDLGRYGLGDRRSLADYEQWAGVDFAARGLSADALSGIEPGPIALGETRR